MAIAIVDGKDMNGKMYQNDKCRGYIEGEKIKSATCEGTYYSNIQVDKGAQLQVWADKKNAEGEVGEILSMSTRIYRVTATEATLIHVFNSLPYTCVAELNKGHIVNSEGQAIMIRKPIYTKAQDGVRFFIFMHDSNIYCVHERNIYLLKDKYNNHAFIGDEHLSTELKTIVSKNDMQNDHFMHVILSPPLSLRGPGIPDNRSLLVSSNMEHVNMFRSRQLSYSEAVSHLNASWYNTLHIRDTIGGQQYVITSEKFSNLRGLIIVPYTAINLHSSYISGKYLSYAKDISAFVEKAYNNAIYSDHYNREWVKQYYLDGIDKKIQDPITFLADTNRIRMDQNRLIIDMEMWQDMPPASRYLSSRSITDIVNKNRGMSVAKGIVTRFAYTMLSAILVSYQPIKEQVKHSYETTISGQMYRETRKILNYLMSFIEYIDNHGTDKIVKEIQSMSVVYDAASRALEGKVTTKEKQHAFMTYVINRPINQPIHTAIKNFIS